MSIRFAHTFLFAILAGFATPTAFAGDSVLSGTFHGAEPTINAFHEGCAGDAVIQPYLVVDSFTVSQSGQYNVVSTQWEIGTDVWFGIYNGPFNPASPDTNRLAQQTIDNWFADGSVAATLQIGTQYTLVVSPWCSPERGVWILAFRGPGEVSSSATVSGLDGFLSGGFDGSGPTATIGCGDGGAREYRVSGAQQVDTSGIYYITQVSNFSGMILCVAVYSTPFDPGSPLQGQLGLLANAYYLPVNLQTGQNYYFVVTPKTANATGGYFYLVTPGTDVYIDPVLSGGWYDPETSGQGFFLDVLGHERALFLGWFTYDLERPHGSVSAMMGDPGHRWLTAFGSFASASASLDLEVTTGGVFNQEGAVDQSVNGSIELQIFDCDTGQIEYDLGTAGAEGVIPIQRISSLNSRPCKTLMQRSGTPRPLNRN